MAGNSPTLVISHDTAKILQKLRRFAVAYTCPRCRADLESRDAAILKGDSCPTCGMTFGFDAEIQSKYAAAVAARQRAEEDVTRRRQEALARRESEKAAREQAEEQRRSEQGRRERLQRERDEAARRRLETHRIENLGDVDQAVTAVLLILGGIAGISAFLGVVTLAQGGILLIASAVSLGLLMPLIAKLFRCLIAIHALLLRIAHAVEKREVLDQ